MKTETKTNNQSFITRAFRPLAWAGALGLFAVASTTLAGILPRQSHAYGYTLAQWNDIYNRWFFESPPPIVASDANGNAVVGKVVLLQPLFPASPGIQLSADVTMVTGQPFVLTMYGFAGFSYVAGTPPFSGSTYVNGTLEDAFLPLSLFQTLQITLTLDGQKLIDSHNAMQYFSQFRFDPAFDSPFVAPPGQAVAWFQGLGLVHTPLPPGKHILTLDATNTQPIPPNFGGSVFELHNTWNITVGPH